MPVHLLVRGSLEPYTPLSSCYCCYIVVISYFNCVVIKTVLDNKTLKKIYFKKIPHTGDSESKTDRNGQKGKQKSFFLKGGGLNLFVGQKYIIIFFLLLFIFLFLEALTKILGLGRELKK